MRIPVKDKLFSKHMLPFKHYGSYLSLNLFVWNHQSKLTPEIHYWMSVCPILFFSQTLLQQCFHDASTVVKLWLRLSQILSRKPFGITSLLSITLLGAVQTKKSHEKDEQTNPWVESQTLLQQSFHDAQTVLQLWSNCDCVCLKFFRGKPLEFLRSCQSLFLGLFRPKKIMKKTNKPIPEGASKRDAVYANIARGNKGLNRNRMNGKVARRSKGMHTHPQDKT